MRIRSVLSVLLASIAALTLVMVPAGAGPNGTDENTVIVEKVVEGPVPEGAVFEVLLTCTPIQASPAPETIAPVTFEFDENGDPIGDNSVGVGLFEECTIEETVTNGADVSYACQMAFPQPPDSPTEAEGNGLVAAECTDDQTAVFYEVIGAEATFTVTNTFEAAPPPDVDPDDVLPDVDDVVAATPTFTG